MRFCFCLMVCVSLLLGVAARSLAAAPEPTPAPISKESLLNRTYRCGDRGAAFVFANGAFAAKIEYTPGIFVDIKAQIVESAIGVATPDGKTGAAVVYTYTTGDGSLYYVLTLALPKDAEPPNGVVLTDAACTELGDRVQINSLKVENGRILVDLLGHGPNDPPTAPFTPQSLSFTLKGDALVENK